MDGDERTAPKGGALKSVEGPSEPAPIKLRVPRDTPMIAEIREAMRLYDATIYNESDVVRAIVDGIQRAPATQEAPPEHWTRKAIREVNEMAQEAPSAPAEPLEALDRLEARVEKSIVEGARGGPMWLPIDEMRKLGADCATVRAALSVSTSAPKETSEPRLDSNEHRAACKLIEACGGVVVSRNEWETLKRERKEALSVLHDTVAAIADYYATLSKIGEQKIPASVVAGRVQAISWISRNARSATPEPAEPREETSNAD